MEIAFVYLMRKGKMQSFDIQNVVKTKWLHLFKGFTAVHRR